MRYLGLDLGSKTLGIAISDKTLTIASVLKTINFNTDDYDSLIEPLKEIIKENEITKIILGYPLNMNGTIGERAEITIEFKKKLENAFQLEVILQDERLTSVISNQVLIDANLSRKKRKRSPDKNDHHISTRGGNHTAEEFNYILQNSLRHSRRLFRCA